MKFNWALLFKVIMAICTALLGANQYAEHQEHVKLQNEIRMVSR